jgi:hypothetical protein
MLSNHVAGTQLHEGVVAGCLWAQKRGVAEITLSHLGKGDCYKKAAMVEGMEDIIEMISFQRHRRQSQNIITNSIYS